ncbi:MAG TPA: YtxH domain-containing protein, partial [Flavobacteriales bacterium]|nr:YtxH domain-containing protein [Flavobacteriales bacterium]
MSSERNYGIFGFLAGAAVGATLGILFAPRSGKETRAIIARRANTAKDDLDELVDKGREQWSKAKGKAADAATMTKEEVNDFIRFLFEEGRDLKDRVSHDVE